MDNVSARAGATAGLDGPSLRDPPGRSFTTRALLAGLLIGLLVNLSNTYYGLRVGAGSQMSMVSGLLGYVGFKVLSRYVGGQLTPNENVLVISVATATGCMPLTAGFVGIIPALEYIIGPDENGPLDLRLGPLVFWSIGLCFFGTIFAALLREHFIEREKLPWPGARATAQVVNTLHKRQPAMDTSYPEALPRGVTSSPADANTSGAGEEDPLLPVQPSEIDWEAAIAILVKSTMVSGALSVLMYFVPVLHAAPIFGGVAGSTWCWVVDFSPGFFGQGIIMGPAVSFHMLFGALVGWGILSPYVKHRGWAPGPVDDWSTGSRGWIIWVSLASLFADAFVKLAWFILRPALYKAGSYVPLETSEPRDMGEEGTGEYPHLGTAPSDLSRTSVRPGKLTAGFVVSVLCCVVAVHVVFGEFIPWYYTLLAVGLSLPMAIVGIRSIAETDYNPESALVSQLTFAMLVSHTNPNATIVNLISAALAQAGANQSGDLAYDLKVGHLVGAPPAAQTTGQIIGSVFGAAISCFIYKIYAANYPIPGTLFPVPSSYLVLSTARLVLGRGLPEGVAPFALATAVLSMLATIVKMRYSDRWWQSLIPSGVSFAIGIYLLPSFTIARAFGGLFHLVYRRQRTGRGGNIVVLASGLVLGESIASLVNLTFTALGVPTFGT